MSLADNLKKIFYLIIILSRMYENNPMMILLEKIFGIILSKTFDVIPKRIPLKKKINFIMLCQGE